MADIQYFPLENLKLDHKNPRLGEFGITERASQEEILKVLWENMAVNELMYSIISNGYWDYEPLVAIEDKNGQYIVVEGNRRLGAVMLIHDPQRIDVTIPQHLIDKIEDDLLEQTKELPVVVAESRKASWQFIGFKHVNGPAKWGSYAKAQYIAEIHNQFGVPLEDIAYQLGDTHNTVQKLYQGLMVLEQARNEKIYDYKEDVQTNRIYFSHLYTGLQREGIQNHLNLKEAELESDTPVPEENRENLGELLEWLYGSKKNDSQPVIKSQNPDLKKLDEVLQDREATMALKGGENLDNAHEISRSSSALFEEYLLAAKRNLQKAKGHVTTGYNGEENLVKVAGTVANMADDLYSEMFAQYEELRPKNKKQNRLSE